MVKFYYLVDSETGEKYCKINDELVNNTIKGLDRKPTTRKAWVKIFEKINKKVFKEEDLDMVT